MSKEVTKIENFRPIRTEEFRQKIDELEESMFGLKDEEKIPVTDFPTDHYLTDNGMYAREIFMPAGTVITGKIKKEEYITVISLGKAVEVTDAGTRVVEAPFTMVAAPGTKRIVWAITDSVWVTVHKTSKENLEEIEEEVIAKTYDEIPNLTDMYTKIEEKTE